MLLILDGLGYGKSDNSNAVKAAKTPFLDHLLATYPHAKLEASGLSVGLPDGQMGNSEVGHMNLGAGRVVFQELGRIEQAIKDGSFQQNPVLQRAFQKAKATGKKVHFMGLLSDGGVHAHIDHLIALCHMATSAGLQEVYIHGFLDGRDTDPHGGSAYIRQLLKETQQDTARLASLIGRYYAMDRDNRWERIRKAYDLLVHGTGTKARDLQEALSNSYKQGVTDEFVLPIVQVDDQNQPIGSIETGDTVICFNFRTDRGREITQALTQRAFPEYEMYPLDLSYITFTSYDASFKDVSVVFEKEDINQTLGEVLAQYGKSQLRIAETEKYPHVTFFFSGGREAPFEHENRILIPSPKVATYDLQPEMSAKKITAAVCRAMQDEHPDFICLNFANPDMVGHTGVFDAVVRAVETVDNCTREVVHCGLEQGYSFIILADHGNAEFMINPDGSVNTAHTTNLVPCILIDKEYTAIQDGKLGDIAPTLLTLMHLQIPEKMTGHVLV